jgi:hypothetical protein
VGKSATGSDSVRAGNEHRRKRWPSSSTADVFFYRAAISGVRDLTYALRKLKGETPDPYDGQLDDYLSFTQIDDENLFNWHPINVSAFVSASNGLSSAPAPAWPPPHITTESTIKDVIHRLQPVAGGHVAWVLLAPNTLEQFAAIRVRLAMLQAHDFIQAAAREAFPGVNSV